MTNEESTMLINVNSYNDDPNTDRIIESRNGEFHREQQSERVASCTLSGSTDSRWDIFILINFIVFIDFIILLVHGENFMAIFTTRSVVIWFSTRTLGIFATLVYVFTMCVVIYDILSMAIIPTLSTSVLVCNLWYILSWISRSSVVKIAIRI